MTRTLPLEDFGWNVINLPNFYVLPEEKLTECSEKAVVQWSLPGLPKNLYGYSVELADEMMRALEAGERKPTVAEILAKWEKKVPFGNIITANRRGITYLAGTKEMPADKGNIAYTIRRWTKEKTY